MRHVIRYGTTLSLIAALMMISMTASAEEPWSPIKPTQAGLITNGIFKKSPIKFPFRQVSVRSISPESNKVGDDFEHTFAVPYEEMLAYFTDPDNMRKGFDIVDGSVFPEGEGKLWRMKGIQEIDKGAARKLRFHHQNVSRDFTVTLFPDGANTRVIFHNLVLTTISSGVMPARAGFVCEHTQGEISFNWN